MKNVSKILLGATLLSVVACGNDSNNSSSKKQSQELLLAEAGHYQATLSPINSHIAGDVSGTAMVKVKGDSFTVEVKVNGSPAQTVHSQNIHIADECPTLSSDTNKDGIIDGIEGVKSYGNIVIPLDSDIKTQVETSSKFPLADFSGNYYYRQTASMVAMLSDLTSKDADSSDNIVKLNSSLGMEGRQIVIYGADKDSDLPATVAAFKGQTKHSSLPIACGSFIKIAVDDEGTDTNGGKDP